MADAGGHGDPPGVEVSGVGGDGTSPPGGGSSVDDRHTSAGTTDAGARGQRTLFQSLPPGLDPTGTRRPAGTPLGRTHPEVAPSGSGTQFGGGQPRDETTRGGGSVPLPTREPAGESSSRAPRSSLGARNGQGLEWRDVVAEVVRSEVTQSVVTMLLGSTRRPAESRGRGRRSSRRHLRDDSSSSSTTDVSRSGDESAVAALLGAFRATPAPSTVRDSTRGIDSGTQPTSDSVGGERGGESYPGY